MEPVLLTGDVIEGFAEGDPLVVGIVVAFVAVTAVLYVVVRPRWRRTGAGAGTGSGRRGRG